MVDSAAIIILMRDNKRKRELINPTNPPCKHIFSNIKSFMIDVLSRKVDFDEFNLLDFGGELDFNSEEKQAAK
jgi:hypothetical protein